MTLHQGTWLTISVRENRRDSRMKILETIVTMGTYDTHKNKNKQTKQKHITTQRAKMRATRQGPQQKWGVNTAAGEPTIHRNYTFNILTVTICSQMVSSSCFLWDTPLCSKQLLYYARYSV
jgi:hypothetical protein